MYWLVIPDSPFFILVIHYISLLDTYFINQFIKNNRCLLFIYTQLLNYTTSIKIKPVGPRAGLEPQIIILGKYIRPWGDRSPRGPGGGEAPTPLLLK